MSYTYLLEGEEEYSAECFSDIPVSVLSRLNLTVEKSSCKDNGTESCQNSQSGMTCEPLTEDRGEDLLMWSVREFPARKFQLPAMEMNQDFSTWTTMPPSGESFTKWDHHSSSWKTQQLLLLGDYEPFSATWPKWGWMRAGECFRLGSLERGTTDPVYGFWLSTPCASESKDRGNAMVLARLDRGGRLARNVCNRFWKDLRPIKVQLNPCFAELSMDWPIGWSALKPLETDKFQQWLSSHGKP